MPSSSSNASLNAAIFAVGCHFKEFEIGFNYDLNVSDISLPNRANTFEISIIYTALNTMIDRNGNKKAVISLAGDTLAIDVATNLGLM